MWEAIAFGALMLATGEAVALAIVLAERRRAELALGQLHDSVRAALDAAERAANASEELRDRAPTAAAIGFRT